MSIIERVLFENMNDNYSKNLFKYNLVIIYFLTLFVIQSEAKNLENIKDMYTCMYSRFFLPLVV